MASAGNPATTVTFNLLSINGSSLQTTTRDLAAGGHLSVFADELFSEAGEGFTGLMEITSPVPMAPVTLKLTTNTRGQSILTTLPLVDLTQTETSNSLIFPQVGFGDFGGGAFATRLILIDQAQASGVAGRLNFFQSDGSALTIPLGQETGSEFPYQFAAGGGQQLRPGVASSGSIAEIILDPVNPSPEIVVNAGNTLQLAPLALDEEGNFFEGVNFSYTSLDTQVATVDAFGEIEGKAAGFSTLTVTAGEVIKTATITVVEVTSGVEGFEITGIAQDLARRLYLANTREHTILVAQELEAVPEVYAGVAQNAGLLNVKRLQSLFDNPAFLVFDQGRGTLYVSDGANHVIRRVEPGPNGPVETLAGTGQMGSADGSATEAQFDSPQGVALDDRGHLWVADSGNHTIRRINLVTGVVETIAGTPGEAGFADGRGEEARFNSPIGMAIEGETLGQELERQRTGGSPPPVSVIVADRDNGVIRRVSEDGLVETVGLTFETTGQQQGATPSISLQREAIVFESPEGVGVDPLGNIYVAEPKNNRVRVILGGAPRSPIGGLGQGGGGVVPAAGPGTFDNPTGIAVPGDGEVVVGGRNNQQIDYGPPEIIGVSPDPISSNGGEVVTIEGRNFSPDSLVIVAGVVIGDPEIQNTQTITFVAPTFSSGRTIVTVQSRGGLAQASLLVEAVPLSELPAGHITTVAGGSIFAGEGGPAVRALLSGPEGIVFDTSGNLYIADTQNARVRRVDAVTGLIITVAGSGQQEFGQDGGPATAAGLFFPQDIALDRSGNLYITDLSRIQRVDAVTGIITTVVGSVAEGPPGAFTGDGGPALAAVLDVPRGLALDGSGNLYIAEHNGHRIRRVDAVTGIITTVAGSGEEFVSDPQLPPSGGFAGDGGPATEARLSSPYGIALDGSGNLFIADRGTHRIRRVDAMTGVITTVAGGGAGGDGGPATAAGLNSPNDITLDKSGNLYITEGPPWRVRRVDAVTNTITTVAGSGEEFVFDPEAPPSGDFSGDGGPATEAGLFLPVGIAVDGSGNLYFADSSNNRIRRVNAVTDIITTVAGREPGGSLGDGEPATVAELSGPKGILLDGSENLYIADSENHRIRRVDSETGIITTIAGRGAAGEIGDFSGDGGPATSAELARPQGIALDGSGNLYISDGQNNRIRRVDALTGIITTVVGSGPPGTFGGFSGDGGPATSAELARPQDIVLDGSGNLYIVDGRNNRIRRVDAVTSIITTVAGGGNESGDGGPATEAVLNAPRGMALDELGNLFIAEFSGIRRVDAMTGIITFVTVSGARGMALDGLGNLYTAEFGGIGRIDVATGTFTIVAGSGFNGLGDGGPALVAELDTPEDVTLDSSGNLYFADSLTHRVRAVRGPIP